MRASAMTDWQVLAAEVVIQATDRIFLPPGMEKITTRFPLNNCSVMISFHAKASERSSAFVRTRALMTTLGTLSPSCKGPNCLYDSQKILLSSLPQFPIRFQQDNSKREDTHSQDGISSIVRNPETGNGGGIAKLHAW